MQKAVRFVDAHLPWCVLAVVGLGLAFPAVFTSYHGLLSLFMGLMTFVSTLGSGFRDLAGVARRPIPVLVTMLILHVAMPAATPRFPRSLQNLKSLQIPRNLQSLRSLQNPKSLQNPASASAM